MNRRSALVLSAVAWIVPGLFALWAVFAEAQALRALGEGPGQHATLDAITLPREHHNSAHSLVTAMVDENGLRRQRAFTVPTQLAAHYSVGDETRVWQWHPFFGHDRLVAREDLDRVRRETTVLLAGVALSGLVLLSVGILSLRRAARGAPLRPTNETPDDR